MQWNKSAMTLVPPQTVYIMVAYYIVVICLNSFILGCGSLKKRTRLIHGASGSNNLLYGHAE